MSLIFHMWLDKLKQGEPLTNEDMIEVLEKMERMDKSIDYILDQLSPEIEGDDNLSIKPPVPIPAEHAPGFTHI